MQAAAIKEARDPYDVKFSPQITPILGLTLEEARANYKHAKSFVDWKGGIACVSGFAGLDLSQFPLDEPLEFEGKLSGNSVHTMIEAVQPIMTPGMSQRQLGAEFAFCGFTCMPVGTPDMVADEIEEWIRVADIDGFNVVCRSGGNFQTLFLTLDSFR
jgi:alkanesulfonate monooxygenase SsuD/methylene tetrahydromethanopterin reductase-like flavin-dependent oxidoreductase (luciferase family)